MKYIGKIGPRPATSMAPSNERLKYLKKKVKGRCLFTAKWKWSAACRSARLALRDRMTEGYRSRGDAAIRTFPRENHMLNDGGVQRFMHSLSLTA